MIYVFIFLLCGIVLFLLIRQHLVAKSLREAAAILDDVLLGNKNRVCHVCGNSKQVLALVSRINSLILGYHGAAEDQKRNEVLTRQFISDISHDIRTPLTSILGYIDELAENPSISEEDRNRYIGVIASKGRTLHKFIDDMFEYVKLEADNTAVRLTKQNLSELVRKMLCFMYQDLAKEGFTAEVGMPEEDLYVLGDETSINRILQNLLSNVLRYGKPGSFGITVREESGKVWVDIWNYGGGISQDELKFIFSRLYRSQDRSRGGSGFGLAIAKRLVQNINGEIGVHSEPNGKTTFSFYLKKYL